MTTCELLTNKKPSHSQISIEPTIDSLYQLLAGNEGDLSKSAEILADIISMCYNSKENQLYLCRNLNLPFSSGPISLNKVPQQMNYTDLIPLLDHIKKVREYYFCWIIYFNEDLQIWSVKFLKFYELQDQWGYIDIKHNLIGIYLGRTSPLFQGDSDQKQLKENLGCNTFDKFGARNKDQANNSDQRSQNQSPYFSDHHHQTNSGELPFYQKKWKVNNIFSKPDARKLKSKLKSISLKEPQFAKSMHQTGKNSTDFINTVSSTAASTKCNAGHPEIIKNKPRKVISTAIHLTRQESLFSPAGNVSDTQVNSPLCNFKKKARKLEPLASLKQFKNAGYQVSDSMCKMKSFSKSKNSSTASIGKEAIHSKIVQSSKAGRFLKLRDKQVRLIKTGLKDRK